MTNKERAEFMVEGWTGGRSKKATGYKKERVDKLIELITQELDRQETQPSNLKSVSNDKYSETYEVVTDETLLKGLKVKAFDMLSGTGLMGCL